MTATEGKTTVLVVEDETIVRMHGMDILEDAGFEVLEAGNADEAMTILVVKTQRLGPGAPPYFSDGGTQHR